MKKALSLISKIQENGNKFIIEELKNNGITGLVPSHGDILAVLYCSTKSTMKDIADRIHRTRPTVTVLVDKLEKLGFVTREISKDDSRYTCIALTQKGKDFKPIFEKISNKLNEKLFKNISDDNYEMLEKILYKMIENIEKE